MALASKYVRKNVVQLAFPEDRIARLVLDEGVLAEHGFVQLALAEDGMAKSVSWQGCRFHLCRLKQEISTGRLANA
jgi:hypothetical protein